LAAEFSYFLNTFIAIFVIVDPFAVLPVYLTLTDRFTDRERTHIRRKASLIAFGLLAMFALTGLSVFHVFGITLPAFRIAGGILLLLLGISQLNSKRERVTQVEEAEGMEKDDISVFPLGMPLLAGPGSISTVILYSSRADSALRKGELFLAILCVIGLSYLLLKAGPLIYRFLGRTGLNLITRLMGIILTAIAVQFIITGIKEAFFPL
jgi:multiple antibiotic resistance protein